MLKKIIVFNFLIGALILLIPSTKVEYKAVEVPKVPLIAQNTPKKAITYKKRVYTPPQGEALEIAEKVSRETGYSIDTISKIMWVESQYVPRTSPQNKNGTYDHGYFQINDIHIPQAEKMGIDIFTPEGNTDFAIYLMKNEGLTPWNASKIKWEML